MTGVAHVFAALASCMAAICTCAGGAHRHCQDLPLLGCPKVTALLGTTGIASQSQAGASRTIRQSESSNQVLQVDEKKVMRKCTQHLVPLFFALAVICYLDRANLAYAALEILEDLNFTETTYSIGAGTSDARSRVPQHMQRVDMLSI